MSDKDLDISLTSIPEDDTSSDAEQRRMTHEEILAKAAVDLAKAALDKQIAQHEMAKENESWVKTYWRPAMGWLYMAICAFDFIFFPMIDMLLPAILEHWGIHQSYQPWTSLTLQNGGMIHIAFGAILGVAAWSRGQERIAMIKD